MQSNPISFKGTGLLNPTAEAYIFGNEDLENIVGRKHGLEDVKGVVKEYSDFPMENRKVLQKVLKNAYDFIPESERANSPVWRNIELLSGQDTFTVTTGQQIHLFLGPLFFIYKIVSLLKYRDEVARLLPNCNIVPVFWMATDDHDLEEINHVQLFGNTYKWQTEQQGLPVGRITLQNFDSFSGALYERLAKEKHASFVVDLFSRCYKEGATLADACLQLLHSLFGEKGLLVLNPDSRELKQLFVPTALLDLKTDVLRKAFESNTRKLINVGFKPQINTRNTNLFITVNNKRLRLDKVADGYKAGEYIYTTEEVEALLHKTPEAFSPNVVLRPVFQQTIMPNILYVCGGSELVYWLQLKEVCDKASVPYPVPYLRNSVYFNGVKMQKLLKKLNITLEDVITWGSDKEQFLIAKASGPNLLDNEKAEFTLILETTLSKIAAVQPENIKAIKMELDIWLKRYKEIANIQTEKSLSDNKAIVEKLLELLKSEVSAEGFQERKEFVISRLAIEGLDFLNNLYRIIDKSPILLKSI